MAKGWLNNSSGVDRIDMWSEVLISFTTSWGEVLSHPTLVKLWNCFVFFGKDEDSGNWSAFLLWKHGEAFERLFMNWDEGSINDKPKMRSRKLYNILNQKEKQIIVHEYVLYIWENLYWVWVYGGIIGKFFYWWLVFIKK